jgi:hypothetical protein
VWVCGREGGAPCTSRPQQPVRQLPQRACATPQVCKQLTTAAGGESAASRRPTCRRCGLSMSHPYAPDPHLTPTFICCPLPRCLPPPPLAPWLQVVARSLNPAAAWELAAAARPLSRRSWSTIAWSCSPLEPPVDVACLINTSRLQEPQRLASPVYTTLHMSLVCCVLCDLHVFL